MNWDDEADYLVVGSGAAGATAGLDLARAGADVLILEEGGWHRQADFRPDLYSALSRLWRDFGGQVAAGRSAFPVAQGCCVGGSTVVNGAAMNRMPEEVWHEWTNADPGLADALPWHALEDAASSVETELQVGANLADPMPSLPMTRALERLGYPHRAMARSAPGCQHANRCLTGCPSGGKWSMERSLIPSALELGARLTPDRRVERILFEGDRAVGVLATRRDGARRGRRPTPFRLRARRGVVLAAGVVHSPLVLRRSGLRNPHLGRHFQCHVGTALMADFGEPVAAIQGPSLGYEVFPEPDLKCNSLPPTPPEVALGNVPAVGRELVGLLRRFDHLAVWNNSQRSGAEGRIAGPWLGLPQIRMTPAPHDFERIRAAVFHVTRLLFEAGARTVYPGLHGVPRRLDEAAAADAIRNAPLDPRAYALNVSHLFGTCRMASDPGHGAVRPDFRSHEREGLFVVDASVFPSAIGTNPQLAVMSLARHAAARIPTCS